jgi:hypothetical protein
VVSVSVLLALAAVGFAQVGTGGAARDPRLALDGMRPLTVAGEGFRAHERVRLVLHRSSGPTRRRARADAAGGFSRAFAGVMVDRCSGFWIGAKGSAGSRARLVRRALPQCPPA